MSKPDAERALLVYKQFSKLTERVVRFLSMARSFETATRIEIPRIKHAPTSLTASLEEYLNDTSFEQNRKEYLSQQDAKRFGKAAPAQSKPPASNGVQNAKAAFPETTSPQGTNSTRKAAKGPSPDLIDFFESIEQNQQPMAQNATQFQQQAFEPQFSNFPAQQQPNMTGFQQQPSQMQQPLARQPTNPFHSFQQQAPSQQAPIQQVQPQATGAGFGGYTPQPQQAPMPAQQSVQSGFGQTDAFGQQPFGNQTQQSPQQMTPQATNPFRQSMMPQPTGQVLQQMPMQNTMSNIPPVPSLPQIGQQTANNPFAQPQQQQLPQQDFNNSQAFPQVPISQQQQQQQPQQAAALLPQRTGTNPFARASPANNASTSQPPGALVSQATGSTNPFRQSTFVNQQTGMGWQAQQGTMGGLENLETLPVFPRPGQPQPQPQQQQHNPGWM